MPTGLVATLQKCPTGISGFDEISNGGLPRGRPTLVAGQAGAGKTLFAFEFVMHGVEEHQEPGVFVSFEEAPEELIANFNSIGFDAQRSIDAGRLRLLHIELDPAETVEAGEYDLEGLFLRLSAAIQSTGARRVALDAVENLFCTFHDERALRTSFRRLVAWLKQKDITAVITTERGESTITRHGLEEYIADCVVVLDNRVEDELATRRLRIVKYRGSAHGTDEYPFVLDPDGFSVIPITSAGLAYDVGSERIPSGIGHLDTMLAGGLYRGSSVLVSGTSGTGKTSIAAHFVDAACRRGERCLYVALEESPGQIVRNMRSIGLELGQWVQAGLLRFHASRTTSTGLETHLASITRLVDEFQPEVVVVDPITAFLTAANDDRVKLMLVRATDQFKTRGITSLFTALTHGRDAPESSTVAISSLVDAWLLLRNLEHGGERTRGLYVCKARGLAHSNQIREFVLTDNGVKLVDVMLGPDGRILTGSARLLHAREVEGQSRDRVALAQRRRAVLETRRRVLDSKIAAMRAEFEDESKALELELHDEGERAALADQMRGELATERSASHTR